MIGRALRWLLGVPSTRDVLERERADFAALCERTMLVLELRHPDGAAGRLLLRRTIAALVTDHERPALLADIDGADGELFVLRLESTDPQPAELYLGGAT